MSDLLELVQTLSMALKAQLMYGAAHPRSQASLGALANVLERWLAEKPSLHLAASSGKVFLDGMPFEGQSVHLASTSRLLGERQISGIIFSRGVSVPELQELLDLLNLKPGRIEELGGAARILEAKRLEHIELGQVQYREVREGEGGAQDGRGPAMRPQTLPAIPLEPPSPPAPRTLDALHAFVDQWREALRGLPRHIARNGEDEAAAARGRKPEAAGPGPGRGFPGSGASGPGAPGARPGGVAGTGPSAGRGEGPGPGGPGSGRPGAGLDGRGASGAGALGPGPDGTGGSVPGGLGSGLDGRGGAGSGASGPGPGGTGHGAKPTEVAWEDLETAAADLSFLANSLAVLGLGDGFPSHQQMEAIRSALFELGPGQLLSVVEGLETLPRSPAGLRLGFQSLAPEAFGRASADLLGAGADAGEPWEALKGRLHGILKGTLHFQGLLAGLEAELRRRGMSLASLQELVSRMDWETMGTEEQIRLVLEQNHLWKLSLEQRLAFLRRLLDEGRTDTFGAALDGVVKALSAEDAQRREAAARTLQGVAAWVASPGLPAECEGPFLQGLVASFGWEPVTRVHNVVTSALAACVAGLVDRGEPGQALALVTEVEGILAFMESGEPWRADAMARLKGSLAEPAALTKVIEMLHTATPETLLQEFIPYLEAVGQPAARRLVDVLGEEEDRKRRSRLAEVIRGLGGMALPAVYEGLESDKWFLVRNALNILADMGDLEGCRPAEACLAHPDGRVRRAAVRTVWKLAGPAAAPALLAAFESADPETMLEIMFAFGQIRANAAIPLLGHLASEKKAPDRLRARAAETLGLIGDPEAIPYLEEVIRRKGRFITTAEPTELRVAACKGLLSVGTPQALARLRALVEAEPRNRDRPLLQQVAEQARP